MNTTAAPFPAGFTWGTATAAYQVEGAVDEDGRLPSIWDRFSHTPGRVAGGDTGDVACDHYHRWPADLDLMATLGIQSYRFSVSWSRVLPDGVTVNQRGLDFYRRLVDGMLERGITPMATLYHWDLPQALDAGAGSGWLGREVVDRFADLATVVGTALGDVVPAFLTLNEPWCSAFLGHATGEHAPGRMRDGLAYAAAHHLNLAHGAAVRALREVLPSSARVGVTLNVHQVEPATPAAADVEAARHADDVANRIFLDPMLRGSYPDSLLSTTRHLTDWSFVRPGDLEACHEPLDFLGVNYYHPVRIGAAGDSAWPGTDRARVVDVPGPRTVMDWPVEASGLTRLLVRLHGDYGLPLVVTENGMSGHDAVGPDGAVHDAHRVAFLHDHVRAVADALAAGVDVSGYYVWSFLDNFEWAWGYDKRFGIVHVDFGTQVRTPKDSAWWYRDLIARGGLPGAAPEVGTATA